MNLLLGRTFFFLLYYLVTNIQPSTGPHHLGSPSTTLHTSKPAAESFFSWPLAYQLLGPACQHTLVQAIGSDDSIRVCGQDLG